MVSRKAGSAVTVSIPDVCQAPPPLGAPVPIPYPSFAATAVRSQQSATRQKTPVGSPPRVIVPTGGGVSSVSGPAAGHALTRAGEVAQIRNGLNQLHMKLQSLATDDPNEWQRILRDYAVLVSALYVTVNDDDS